VEVDASNRIVDANVLVCEWSGIALVDLVGRAYDCVVRRSGQFGDARIEYPPGIAELVHADDSLRPVLVAEGKAGLDGRRFVSLFDATAQRKFQGRLQDRLSFAQRSQMRLELVIAASISFAGATNELDLAEILAAATARAYSAEDTVVFLLDERGEFSPSRRF
jgi:hypothetical protein